MPILVAAFDKFRGTATAAQACRAAADAAREAGWDAIEIPLSDGGEGFLEAMGGEERRTVVSGPLGAPVEARWRLREGVAVIECAEACGLLLAGGAGANDPKGATTRGVGELVIAARDAGARQIVVGCGGSASTDGGWGAVDAIREAGGLRGCSLVAATDVRTRFRDAAWIFGPQKGADPAMVVVLEERLASLAVRYRGETGVDVDSIEGSGAAGGLSGGLAVLGARIESGFERVASMAKLDAKLESADLVVTGEGRFDATSLEGKVVGRVIERAPVHLPLLIVAGEIADGSRESLRAAFGDRIATCALVERYGRAPAIESTIGCLRDAVGDFLRSLPVRSRA